MENSKTAFEQDHDEAQIRSALAAILESDQFRRSPRLREFLTFIVERKLAGAEDQIVGKAIAEQVYGRNLTVNAKDESLVRVDAGRVRRALADYYAGSGKGDSVEFAIPVGSYRPIFSSRQTGQAGTKDKYRQPIKSNHLFAAIAAVIVIGIVVLGTVYFRTGSMDRPGQAQLRDQAMREKRIELVRRAMFQKSPASLQAYDFAQQARGLIFPPTNPDRLKLARQHFEDAIALDPEFYGGYAGAAQVMAFLAFLPWVPETEKNLEAARDYSTKARNLAPGNAWVQSSLAWVAFVAGEFEHAKELAALALDLDPLDWHVV
jgi:tetratricopeptide (TPR) repeat protein